MDQSAQTHPSQEPPHGARLAGCWSVELLPAMAYEACYAPEHGILGFAFEAQSGTHAFASDHRKPFVARPNHLSWVPPGCEVYSSSPRGGEYLRILFEGAPVALPERRIGDLVDPASIAAAQRLRRQLLGAPGGLLEVEQAVVCLEGRIAAAAAGPLPQRREAGWMTPRRFRRVSEMIEERLGEALTVQMLAGELGLSAAVFSRMFKAACGTSPYDYILERRLARARRLIAESADGLAAIAYRTGFSSQAHMAGSFRKRLGLAPSSFRLQGRGRNRG